MPATDLSMAPPFVQTLRPVEPPRPTRRRRAPQIAATRAELIADYLAICALDPAVVSVRERPEPALFDVDGAPLPYAADVEVLREDARPVLVDVVADADLNAHPFRMSLVTGEPAVAADGRELHLETAATLRAEPRLTTLRLVLACRRTFVCAGDRVRILHCLDECGTARLVDCAAVVRQGQDGVAAVLALALEGFVALDIDAPILPETPVRRRKRPAAEPADGA
jgi:hypothetical protein